MKQKSWLTVLCTTHYQVKTVNDEVSPYLHFTYFQLTKVFSAKFFGTYSIETQRHNHKYVWFTVRCSNTCFGVLLLFSGTQHGNPHHSLVTESYFSFHGPAREPALATPSAMKIERGSGKNEVECTQTVEIRKKFLAVSEVCIAVFWHTPDFNRRTVNRSGFFTTEGTLIFCVRSVPLRD